jgi:glucose-1-phosphate thymidylyltransferase
MKGIVLAGGTGSRLWPITKSVGKQLLPVYDKPMIYYPISTLMLAGIREILIITTPQEQQIFKTLLGDGSKFGVRFDYQIQESPKGLAHAYILAEEFLNGDSSLMILGDNIFYGSGLGQDLKRSLPKTGAHVFTYQVANPNQYGILTLDGTGAPLRIEEKPETSISNLAVTGLYFFDNRAVGFAKQVIPSARGELEITSIIDQYLQSGHLTFTQISRGAAWLDTGSPKAMNDASNFIRVIEDRTALKVACLEEIAWLQGWISSKDLLSLAQELLPSEYGIYLVSLTNQ